MLQTKKYYTYQIGNYIYEIETTKESTEIWMYHKNYGIKIFIIGVPERLKEEEIIYYIKLDHKGNRKFYKEEVENKG